MRGRLHAGHEEDAELAPHAREGQRDARLAVQVHEVVANGGVLREVPRSPASPSDTSAGAGRKRAGVKQYSSLWLQQLLHRRQSLPGMRCRH